MDLCGDASREIFCPPDALVWGDRVYVGFGHRVYVIDPKKQSALEIHLGREFLHFYASQDYLLVASADSLLRLALDCTILWRTSNLAIDGVVVNSVENGLILGEGEWDPPGGWKPFTVRLDSGALIAGGPF